KLFLWGFAGGRSPPAKPPHFFSPPQRHLRRWGGDRGQGKNYSSPRFIHRRLVAWRQAEQLPHIFFLNGARQHQASQQKSESAEKRISTNGLMFCRRAAGQRPRAHFSSRM
ncbi:MAG TPA: hypothetical protein PKY49_10470, partial [Anaerolineae bacterium]|nr:hypothetical protein [Anaerolineae bacterium]